MKSTLALVLLQAALARCSPNHAGQQPLKLDSRPEPIPSSHHASDVADPSLKDPAPDSWLSKYGQQKDLSYTGPVSFSHLEYARCLEDPSINYDVAILGMPFDTTVTYRPGARFGPHGIRLGSRRHSGERGYTLAWGISPYDGIKAVDCGDVSIC